MIEEAASGDHPTPRMPLDSWLDSCIERTESGFKCADCGRVYQSQRSCVGHLVNIVNPNAARHVSGGLTTSRAIDLDSHFRLRHLPLAPLPTRELQLAAGDARSVLDSNLRSDEHAVFRGTVVQLGREASARVLLDTGAEGNYVSADFVSEIQLEVTRDSDEDQRVAVVNGSHLPIEAYADFTLKLEAFTTYIHARVLDLEDHDVILGRECLQARHLDIDLDDDTLYPSFLSNTQPSPPTLRWSGAWVDNAGLFDDAGLETALKELSKPDPHPKSNTTPQARLEEKHVASSTDVLVEGQAFLALSTPSRSTSISGRGSTKPFQVAVHLWPDDGESLDGGVTLGPTANILSTKKEVALRSGRQSSIPDTESVSGTDVDQGQYFLVSQRHTESLLNLPLRDLVGHGTMRLTQPFTSSAKQRASSGRRPLSPDQQRLAHLLVKFIIFCYLGAKATHGQLWKALAQQTSGHSEGGFTDCSQTNELAGSNKRPRINQKPTGIHPLHDKDGQERDNDDPGHGRNTPEAVDKREKNLLSQKSWACPYNKADPIKFSCRNSQRREYQLCSVVKLSSIATLKQHLERVHQRPEFCCETCYIGFKNSESLHGHTYDLLRCPICCHGLEDVRHRDAHVQDRRCIPKNDPYKDKMSASAECKVFRKYREPNGLAQLEREQFRCKKWYEIFEAIFPNHRRPDSPYAGDQEAVHHFLQTFLTLGRMAHAFYATMQASSSARPLPELTAPIVHEAYAIFLERFQDGTGLESAQDCLPDGDSNVVHDAQTGISPVRHSSGFLDETLGLRNNARNRNVVEDEPSFLVSESSTLSNSVRDGELLATTRTDRWGLNAVLAFQDHSHHDSGTGGPPTAVQQLEEASDTPLRPSDMLSTVHFFSDFQDLLPTEFDPYHLFDNLSSEPAAENQIWDSLYYDGEQ